MKTLGVDLSAQPKKTAACEIDWTGGTIRLVERPIADETLVEEIIAADMTAIDVPLGWPDGFVDAITAHRDVRGWPPIGLEPPADRVALRYRGTDIDLVSAGVQPLSVSTDRIGVMAMRGARLQHLLREAGATIDRSGTTGILVETYPAAALRSWGLPAGGYKGTKNANACQALVAALGARCGGLASTVTATLDGCDDDTLDALICAVVARAAALGLTRSPEPDQLGAAQREGWIHVPTADLETIMHLSVGGLTDAADDAVVL